jgi:hypothetical protein
MNGPLKDFILNKSKPTSHKTHLSQSPPTNKTPKPRRERKGPLTFPIMSTPCPSDPLEAAQWCGTRLAIQLQRIPADQLHTRIPCEGCKVPNKKFLEEARKLTIACGFSDTNTKTKQRTTRCFWKCVTIAKRFHQRGIAAATRQKAFEIVINTVQTQLAH